MPRWSRGRAARVCDARCEMCSNWKRGDRKTDMTFEQVDRVCRSDFWRKIEMANGGTLLLPGIHADACIEFLVAFATPDRASDFESSSAKEFTISKAWLNILSASFE